MEPQGLGALVAAEQRDLGLPDGCRIVEGGPLRSGACIRMADITGLPKLDATAFALELVREPGVAVIPGPSFFSKSADGRSLVRFCFCKRDETLDEAAARRALGCVRLD